jgi:ABC-type multidrug transport system ATPase subunit
MNQDGLAVRLRGVTKSFGRRTAVSDLDLDVPRGIVYGLLGPNGSGKTTTIRMIMGILHPDVGTVALFGAIRTSRAAPRSDTSPRSGGSTGR